MISFLSSLRDLPHSDVRRREGDLQLQDDMLVRRGIGPSQGERGGLVGWVGDGTACETPHKENGNSLPRWLSQSLNTLRTDLPCGRLVGMMTLSPSSDRTV